MAASGAIEPTLLQGYSQVVEGLDGPHALGD